VREDHEMRLDPKGDVCLNFQQKAHCWAQHAIFEWQWWRSSQVEAPLSRHGLPHDVIGRILTSEPASDGECRLRGLNSSIRRHHRPEHGSVRTTVLGRAASYATAAQSRNEPVIA
jgi:hypothetical protein